MVLRLHTAKILFIFKKDWKIILNEQTQTDRWKNVDDGKYDEIHRQTSNLKFLRLLPQRRRRRRRCDGRRLFVDSDEGQNDADECENDSQKKLNRLRKNDEH